MKKSRLLELAGVPVDRQVTLTEKFEITTDEERGVVNAFVCRALFAVMQVHLWHLQTGSFAEHMAIGEFYETLDSKTDAVAEQFIGVGGVIKAGESYKLVDYSKEAVRNLVDEIGKLAASTVDNVNGTGTITVTLEEIEALAAKTLFKLRYP